MGKFLGVLVVAALVSSSPLALAYTPTVSQSGIGVRWPGAPRIPLAGNPTNRSGLSEANFRSAVVRSLQRWKYASGGAVTFDYWQGTDAATYEPSSEYNGLSSIYFASNARGNTGISSNVLGLTQVWYNTENGQILETDIVLNDVNYRFTTNPRDTSGYGSGFGSTGDGHTVFIENVLTHELGHSYGLSHSGGLQSTMLFMESPEQAFLGCDEQVGIHAVYPNGDAGARGAITGTVASASGPVFGAHVLAISRRRGTVLATAVTDRNGRYNLAALESGAYFVMVEPFFAGASALPAYYSGINPNVCSGRMFSRTIQADGSGAPQAISVGAGGATEAGSVTVRCESGGGAAANARSATASISGAPVIYNGATGGSGFGAMDRFAYSSSIYYRLQATSGRIEAHAMAYSLYAPVDPTIEILDNGGRVVSTQSSDNVYPGTSGYVNYDAAAIATGLPAGDYYLRVTYAGLNSSNFPAGGTSLDTVPFVLVTGSVNEGDPSLAGTLAANARCRMDENFAAYASPAGGPERHSMNGDDDGTGFCGTVERAGDQMSKSGRGPKGMGGGPSTGAMAGWMLPWLFMGLVARLARRSAGLRAREARATL